MSRRIDATKSGTSPRRWAASIERSRPARTATSIVCSSQRRRAPVSGARERTSSSRVVRRRHAAPSSPSRTMRWMVASTPPVRPFRGMHGSASFGGGSLRAPFPSSTATSAKQPASSAARSQTADVRLLIASPAADGRRARAGAQEPRRPRRRRRRSARPA